MAGATKGRGLCPSCGARQIHDVATHFVERVFPEVPIRQYVLSPPSEWVGLLAARADALAAMARVFVEAIFRGQRARPLAQTKGGAVVFVQRFTKTLSVAVQGAWFGARKFEPATPVPYREAWAKLLARVHEVNGYSCPRCSGTLRPFGAVLPPQAAEARPANEEAPLIPTQEARVRPPHRGSTRSEELACVGFVLDRPARSKQA